MSLKINLTTSEDISFEGGLLLAPASNYSDGPDKGFRPAIRWAMVHMPNVIARSGLMNLKDEDACDTSSQAVTRAKARLFDPGGDCICSYLVDAMLEEFEREP